MAKLTLEEKRLQALRTQLLGKDQSPKVKFANNSQKPTDLEIETVQKSTITTLPQTFVKNDLIKIFILSAIAVGTQLILFWTLKMNFIHLGF
jgi:hypothetical protein